MTAAERPDDDPLLPAEAGEPQRHHSARLETEFLTAVFADLTGRRAGSARGCGKPGRSPLPQSSKDGAIV